MPGAVPEAELGSGSLLVGSGPATVLLHFRHSGRPQHHLLVLQVQIL